MKKIVVLCVVVAFLALGCNYKNYLRQDEQIEIDSHTYSVQVANTPQELAQGLGGIKQISDGEGMLFVFSAQQTPSFWMKGMQFDIDILWISGDTIIGTSEGIPAQEGAPDASLTLYSPPSPVDKVLEVNSGWVFRRGIKVGDKVTIIPNK